MHCCGRVFKREFSFLFFTPPEEWVALAHEKINVALPVMRQVKSKMMENWERQYDLYWLTRNWGKEEEEKRERESYLSPGELGSHDPQHPPHRTYPIHLSKILRKPHKMVMMMTIIH